MRMLAILLLVFAHLSPMTLWGALRDRDPFADCEADLAARPDGWASLCFLYTAREHQLWAEAQWRVSAHLTSKPADPYLQFTLGFLELEGGSLPRAAEHFRAAATAFADRAEPEGEALAWMNLGECLMRQGLLEATGRALQRAEDAARAATDPGLRVRVRIRQTQLIRRQGGDLEGAERGLQEMEEALSADTGYRIWKSLLYERAVTLHRLGRYHEARRVNARWAQMARSAGELYDQATALASVAVNVVDGPPRPGTREEAIQLAREALEAADGVGNRSAAITAHLLLGKLHPDEAGRTHLEECLRLTSSAGDSRQQAACLFALAGSLATEDGEQARATLDQAVALALTSEEPYTAALGWADRLRVSWATRPRNDAIGDSLAVLDHIEALRQLQSSESGRADFFTDWVAVYHALAGYLLTAPDDPSHEELETAFTVAERLRARVLLDSLATAQVEPPTPVDENLAFERTAVLQKIVRLQRALLKPLLNKAERRGLLADLDLLELDLEEVEARLGLDSPTDPPETGFLPLARAEAALSPEQAILVFLIAPDVDVYDQFAGGSWLLAVTGSGTRAYHLPGGLELEIKVGTFLGLVEDRNDLDLELGAVTLYDDLFGAALAELPAHVQELILVPDGILHLLPFGLLRPHPQADPLVTSYRLSEAPSVTLWHRWRQSPATPAPAALALADPAFVGATVGPAASISIPSEDRQWALEAGGRLGRLPYAANEGRALLRRLGGPPSRLRIGEEASEAFLKGASLDGFGVLHFAAHALVDSQRPRRSALLLAAGGAEQDGLLQPREIAALDLSGKLVVISACNSGSGQVLLGEGVQSLARAFFRAGARAVVASLWRLEDDEAEVFFDLFYRALAEGRSVAGAVAEAQRDLQSRGAPAAAWAGLVVLGDGAMVPLPGGVDQSGGWWLFVLLPVAAALVWLFRRARHRHEP